MTAISLATTGVRQYLSGHGGAGHYFGPEFFTTAPRLPHAPVQHLEILRELLRVTQRAAGHLWANDAAQVCDPRGIESQRYRTSYIGFNIGKYQFLMPDISQH